MFLILTAFASRRAKIKNFTCFNVFLPDTKRLPGKYIFIIDYPVDHGWVK